MNFCSICHGFGPRLQSLGRYKNFCIPYVCIALNHHFLRYPDWTSLEMVGQASSTKVLPPEVKFSIGSGEYTGSFLLNVLRWLGS